MLLCQTVDKAVQQLNVIKQAPEIIKKEAQAAKIGVLEQLFTYLPTSPSSHHLCHTDMDAAHHRHWPGVLKVIAGCHISLFQMPLPEDTVQLGGSMSLHGNHMTLACFHGPNFRSKSWALFHLEEPNIAFWTEAQKIWEDGETKHAFLGIMGGKNNNQL